MEEYKARYPTLWQLTGSYINQDVFFSYGNLDSALEEFLRDQPDDARELVEDITTLLRKEPTEDEAEEVLTELGIAFEPHGRHTSYRQWLRNVTQQVEEFLEAKRGPTPQPSSASQPRASGAAEE